MISEQQYAIGNFTSYTHKRTQLFISGIAVHTVNRVEVKTVGNKF